MGPPPINSLLVKRRAIERWGPCENFTNTDIDETISEFLEEMARNGEDQRMPCCS